MDVQIFERRHQTYERLIRYRRRFEKDEITRGA